MDLSITNINPFENSKNKNVIDILKIKGFPEDTLLDIKNKIWVYNGIPTFRQHIFLSNGIMGYDIYVNNILIPVNIKDWLNKKCGSDSEIKIKDIPIDKYLVENKENIKVVNTKQYSTIGRNKSVFLVDLDTIITKEFIYESNIRNDLHTMDLIYYGFVIKFYPLLSYSNFKTYIKEHNVDDLIDYDMQHIIKKELQIMNKIHTTTTISKGKVSILNQHIFIDLGVRYINIRNILDKYVTTNKIPAIISYINDADTLDGNLIVKKHISCDEIINKVIKNTGLLKVTKNTLSHVSFVIKRSINNYIVFSIKEQGLGSEIFIDYNEDEHIDLNNNLRDICVVIRPIINYINNNLQYVALPFGNKLQHISNNIIVDQKLHIASYWKQLISLKTFVNMKDKLKSYEDAGILTIRQDECSHNDYHQENCFMVMFKKGMYNPEGREVIIKLRTTDIRLEVNNIKDFNEFVIIQRVLFYFFDHNSKGIKDSRGAVDIAKYNLKTLYEKDPVLYDIKRYNSRSKVYSVMCQSTRQPILYTEEEFNNLSMTQQKKLIKYWNFTDLKPAYYDCPNKEFPYLSFKVGKHPKNYCLPCCNKAVDLSNTYDTCLEKHVYDEISNNSKYILTYGKPIPINRISRISNSIIDIINQDTNNYVLYGVDQDLPGINNCGIITSIFTSLADYLDMDYSEFIDSFIKKVTKYGQQYYLIGNGVASVFDSVDQLTDCIRNIFVFNNIDIIIETEAWNQIILSLVKDIYNLEVVVWDDFNNNENIKISNDYTGDDKLLIIINNKTGAYPIYIVDDDIFHSMIVDDKNPLIEALYTLVNKYNSLIVSDVGSSQLCVYDSLFKSPDSKWTPVNKLLDSRNLCYGLIITSNISKEYVYLPVNYTTTGKYFNDLVPLYSNKPKYSYNYTTLYEFINDVNSYISNNNTCKMRKIEPESYVQNIDNKYVGFQVGRLYYLHDPIDTDILKLIQRDIASSKIKKMIYNPFDIDEAISKFCQTSSLYADSKKNNADVLIESTKLDTIAQLEYTNRLYELFTSEFLYLILNQRNKIVRSKLHKLISNTDYDSSCEIHNLFESLDKLSELNYDDRIVIKKTITDTRDGIKVKVIIDNTVFSFDETLLLELQELSIDKTEEKVKKIMMDRIVFIDITEINYNNRTGNIHIPCQASTDSSNLIDSFQAHCKGKKLKMIRNLFDDYVKILSADIHNKSILGDTNFGPSSVFDPLEFIINSNENITMFRK